MLYRSVFIEVILGLETASFWVWKQHPFEGSNPQLVVSAASVTCLIFRSRKPRLNRHKKKIPLNVLGEYIF